MTVITCNFTDGGFVFLLSRGDAAELQTRAHCPVFFLREGEDGRRIQPSEPARPRLRVSDVAVSGHCHVDTVAIGSTLLSVVHALMLK